MLATRVALLAFSIAGASNAFAKEGCLLPYRAEVGTIAVRLGTPEPTTVTFLYPEVVRDGRPFRMTVTFDTAVPQQKALLDLAIAAKHAKQDLITGIFFARCLEDLLERYPSGKARVKATDLQSLIEWGRDDFNHRDDPR